MRVRLSVFAICAMLLPVIALAADAAATVFSGWPFGSEEAVRRQQRTAAELGCEAERMVKLSDDVSLSLVLIPAGEFVMGAPKGESPLDPDESPPVRITIDEPFWVGRFEVTNQQYRVFKPDHNSREIDTHWKDRVGPGPTLNRDTQPVVRISWLEAKRFCGWLSEKTGLSFRLPGEPEWEYACRAGTQSPFSCPDADLHTYANFADASLRSVKPWALRDQDRNDGSSASADVGKYLPNPWGLQDMHGNVAEWCETPYAPYPLTRTQISGDYSATGPRAVRGGSWDDRPRRCRSAFRLSYPPDYRVYNVGFRVLAPASKAQ